MYKYQIEHFINGIWITSIRYYRGKKDLNSFDLFDIPGKRRNAKLINK